MSKVLQLSLVLVLALPPAWCCAAPVPRAADTAAPVVQHSCCSHRSAPASDESSAPVPVATQCCCQKDWKPSPRVEPVIFTALPVELLTDLLPELAAGASLTAQYVVANPPLHILQCVWRC